MTTKQFTTPFLRLSPEGWDGVVDSYRNTDSRDLQEVKAVYAPVYPEVQSVKRRFGKVRIPVRNDFDFTDLSTVRIVWQQYCDSKLVLEGEERLKARPHSSAVLKLKARKPEGRKAGRKAIEPFPLLRCGEDAPFCGSMVIRLIN